MVYFNFIGWHDKCFTKYSEGNLILLNLCRFPSPSGDPKTTNRSNSFFTGKISLWILPIFLVLRLARGINTGPPEKRAIGYRNGCALAGSEGRLHLCRWG